MHNVGWIWLSLDSSKQEFLSLPLPLYFQLVYLNLFGNFKGVRGFPFNSDSYN